MLSNDVRTTFAFEESDFLLISAQSGANFNVNPMFSLMENRVTPLKGFCKTSS